MPQYSLKLCTYDPGIIDAFDRLRRNRKQAAFTHEALKEFLNSEKGRRVLQLMEGKESGPSSPDSLSPERLTNRHAPAANIVSASQVLSPVADSRDVLDSILS